MECATLNNIINSPRSYEYLRRRIQGILLYKTVGTVIHYFSSRRYNPLWVCIHSPLARLLASSFEVSISHTTTRHNRQESSERVISSSQRPLPDNTQHSQQTDFHAPSGIRTHNFSRRAAAYLRLRTRGHLIFTCYIQQFSPYRTVNTFRLGYTNQSVNAVQGNNRCLF